MTRRRALDLGVLGALGAGLVGAAAWMGRWQTLPGHPRAFAALFVAQLALYALAGGWVVWRKPGGRATLTVLALVSLAAQLALVTQRPTASDDIYRYVWDGRVQAQGLNPYQYAPNDPALAPLRDAAIYPHINRPWAHTIYPPVAQAVFRVVYAAHPDSVTWTKLVFIACDLATLALLTGLLARLGQRPELVVLFAWHPLLLLEVAHSGHVDAVALLLLTLALRARVARQPGRVGVWLAAAALVKFYAVVALPALLFREWRKDARALGALASTATLAYLPFLGVGRGVFGYLGGYVQEEGIASGGRFYLLGRAHDWLPRAVWQWLALGPLTPARAYQGALLAVMAGLALWAWRARGAPEARVSRAALLYATLLILATPAYPWYALLLLACLPATRGRALLPALLVPSLAGLLYLQWWLPSAPRWPRDLAYGSGALCLTLVALWSAAARAWTWRRRRRGAESALAEPPSLFDRFPRLYALCRERLFRDHTRLIATALWPSARPTGSLVELGCGPGFYARRFAARHAGLRVVGLDRSAAQLRQARARAGALSNCRFEQGDALRLPWTADTHDAVVVSRLFTVLPERERALAEAHRVLRPAGRCFIAEPRSRLWTALPLRALWLLADLSAAARRNRVRYREPRRPTVLCPHEFEALAHSQPWEAVRVWSDRRYHFALCVKGAPPNRPAADVAAD